MSQLDPAAAATGTTATTQPHNEIVAFRLISTSTVVPVQIQFTDGTIFATPNGGAVRAKGKTPVRWECNRPFSITFAQLGGQSAPIPGIESGLNRGPDGRFTAQVTLPDLAEGAPQPYYEYTITVDDLRLDPIVIVDK
jgi:hypothetical protein